MGARTQRTTRRQRRAEADREEWRGTDSWDGTFHYPHPDKTTAGSWEAWCGGQGPIEDNVEPPFGTICLTCAALHATNTAWMMQLNPQNDPARREERMPEKVTASRYCETHGRDLRRCGRSDRWCTVCGCGRLCGANERCPMARAATREDREACREAV